MDTKTFDILLFGATSFVGQIVTKCLFDEIGLSQDIKWAIAGRSETKLRALKATLGDAAKDLPVIVADSSDSDSLNAMCRQSRVILSTIGPYALYGEPLIKACVENGNDYCDLTGEAYWIKRMMDRYESAAKASGARIVNCCGFDSIPSDLGVHFLQQVGAKKFGQFFDRVSLRVKAMKGGASGGTIASVIEMFIAAKADPELRRAMGNPYMLCPEDHSYKNKQTRIKGPIYDKDFHCWSAPFIMEAINARVVLRSNALLKMAYGDNFSYGEGMLTGKGKKGYLRAFGLSLGLASFALGIMLKPVRKLMQRFLLPKPGEGPSQQQQADGYFDIRILGTNNRHQARIKVSGDRDPGYGCTAKMLTQAGLCMAFDIAKSDLSGGFWTPATAMGDALIERLSNSAGMSFELED
ncbi:MAG: saccharopine dehydrogenase NADP-binding domain-containing protein [Porticoccaceae bacterium]|nr:saccharopine dehydrogenase NADP-binding domain-containing protein [Porticoccaceae bacterium]